MPEENQIEDNISFKGNLTHQIRLIQDAEDFRDMLNKVTILSVMLNPWKDEKYREKVEKQDEELREGELIIAGENMSEGAFQKLNKFSCLLDLMKRKNLLFKKQLEDL